MADMDSENRDSETQMRNNSGDDARTEFNAAVEELLNTIQNKFAGVSSEIFAKLDDMSSRLDKLEAELRENNSKDNSSKP
ncbi:Heat shock factor binding 1 [Cordyceps militaris CM01]|uniref:Heat shock factor binding 1 n=1 Tax=Cordyceps militaris (strain CM01) TaxID=983644 RepID=G3J4Q5_CORMM|nr:Heat shock factor binding 1 [Cordyceps militaris CM01]EGX96720.1 Heat shock factor binding 1 [Cordyceps militaris CM01]